MQTPKETDHKITEKKGRHTFALVSDIGVEHPVFLMKS